MKLRRELPLYLRAFDALMRPQIHGFALRTVLATSESELMKGAALAARCDCMCNLNLGPEPSASLPIEMFCRT
eukprot:6209663-Pleurochrysis_carterae.AAC.2